MAAEASWGARRGTQFYQYFERKWGLSGQRGGHRASEREGTASTGQHKEEPSLFGGIVGLVRCMRPRVSSEPQRSAGAGTLSKAPGALAGVAQWIECQPVSQRATPARATQGLFKNITPTPPAVLRKRHLKQYLLSAPPSLGGALLLSLVSVLCFFDHLCILSLWVSSLSPSPSVCSAAPSPHPPAASVRLRPYAWASVCVSLSLTVSP